MRKIDKQTSKSRGLDEEENYRLSLVRNIPVYIYIGRYTYLIERDGR